MICSMTGAEPVIEPKILGSRRLYRLFKGKKNSPMKYEDPFNEDPRDEGKDFDTISKILLVTHLKSEYSSASSAGLPIAQISSSSKPESFNKNSFNLSDLEDKMRNLKDAVEQSIVVEAGREICFSVAADFERYPEWAGSVQFVNVLERNSQGLGSVAEYKVGAFGTSLSYTLAYDLDQPQRMAWTAVAGSVRELVGAYDFETLENGNTKV